MVSLTGLVVWLGLLMTCTVCLKASTETLSPKRKRIFLGVGWSAGLVAFWIIIIAVLSAIHSVVWGFICLVVALVVTLLFAHAIARSILTRRVTP